MIRKMRDSDIPRLKELNPEFEWTFGRDFMGGVVVTDENDSPVMFSGAWRRAEVHMAVDSLWETPGLRYAALRALHVAMENELRLQDVGQAVTWFAKCEKFCRRLKALGWTESGLTSFHRGISNGQ